MMKFTQQKRSELKAEGYSDEEILRMEMEAMEETEEEGEEELAVNSDSMRSVPWDELKAAGKPDMKRAGVMQQRKVKK